MALRNINVVFKNGHLYDLNTNERVVLFDSTEIALIGEANSFLVKDPNNLPHDIILDTDCQKAKVESKKKHRQVRKLISRDYWLFFKIRLTIEYNGKKPQRVETVFRVRLLEDLYVYESAGNNAKQSFSPNNERQINIFGSQKPSKNMLCDCACIVEANPTGNIEYFEPIFADSLNDSYKKTYVHYFGNHGASTCNAFDTFYLKREGKVIMVRDL